VIDFAVGVEYRQDQALSQRLQTIHLLLVGFLFSCFSSELSGKIDAFLMTAHCYGFSANIVTESEFLYHVARNLFKEIQRHKHYLNSGSPEKKNPSLALRPRRR